MVRGVKKEQKEHKAPGMQVMSKQELDAAEQMPIPEEHKDFQEKVNKQYQRDANLKPDKPGQVKKVGDFKAKVFGDSKTLARFKKTQIDYEQPVPVYKFENYEENNTIHTSKVIQGFAHWQEATPEQAKKFENDGLLMGYSPADGMALVKQLKSEEK